MATLVPWSVHYYRQTGHVSLATSQRGIVAFISLGELPHNPWGVEYKDEDAVEYLRSRGIDLPAQSDSADRVLLKNSTARGGVRRRVLEEGGLECVYDFVSGVYNDEPRLSDAEEAQLASLLSTTKSTLHLEGDRDGDAGGQIYRRVVMALVYWVVAKGVVSLVTVLTAIGLAVGLVRGLRLPLMLFLAAYIVYQFLLLLALATEPRYLYGL